MQVCLAPEGAQHFQAAPAPLSVSRDTAAPPQMNLCDDSCPCPMLLSTTTTRPASILEGEHLGVIIGLRGLQGPPVPQCFMVLKQLR